MSHTNLVLGSNWGPSEWPEYVDVSHDGERGGVKYVSKRTRGTVSMSPTDDERRDIARRLRMCHSEWTGMGYKLWLGPSFGEIALVNGSKNELDDAVRHLAALLDPQHDSETVSTGPRDGTPVSEMVAEWLRDHGYQGLVRDDLECGCGLGDLMPCGVCDADGCAAAHEFRCRECASSDRCDKSNGDFVYSTDESWCEDFEGRSAS